MKYFPDAAAPIVLPAVIVPGGIVHSGIGGSWYDYENFVHFFSPVG